MLIKLFTKHPQSVGETYFQHGIFAFWCGLRLIFAGAACVIHSIFPFLFSDTASSILQKILQEMAQRKK